MAPTIALTRAQIARMAGNDADTTRQIESIVSLTNLTGFGQSQTSEDVVLDADGLAFSATLPVGRTFVDFVVLFDVVGGTPADGVLVSTETTAGITEGGLSLCAGDATATAMAAAPTTGALVFSAVDGGAYVRGFVDVHQPGVFGFRMTIQGAPTSVTILAGSGLTTTKQREAT